MISRLSLFAFSAAATMTISCSNAEEIEAPPLQFETDDVIWVKGDFHVHSSHSNDAAENHVAEIVERARDIAGMDFFVITDHDNHLDGDMTPSWDDPAYSDHTMTLLYGVEYTTGFGHANIFGTQPWDHPQLYALREEQASGKEIVELAHEMGLHFSINHPTGKDLWEFDFDINYDSMEIWNALWTFPNPAEKNLELWDQRVALEGRRIPMRGGSDCHHHRDHFEAEFNNIGSPTTWLRVEENSPEGILKALGEGRGAISYSPQGERVAIWLDRDLDGEFETMMGDSVLNGSAETVRLGVDIGNAEAGVERTILVFNQDNTTTPVATVVTSELKEVIELPALETGYYRVQLKGKAQLGQIQTGLNAGVLSISNPIYFGIE